MKHLTMIVFMVVIYPMVAWACGTVESRYERYEEAQSDEERFIELKFLNCASIANAYRANTEQSSKILHLVESALIEGKQMAKRKTESGHEWKEMYYKDLAVKLFIRFKCYSSPATKRQSEISWRIRQAYQDEKLNILALVSELPKDHWLHSDADLGKSSETYAALLREQVKLLMGK